ncbi:MAG: GIY-YIG nuclease family protein [Anaerococcus prevotii]|uniref:GIY-YIG nuclease family protein n=1 Tax=Anaerococcus prevotii TaxID=33034 RepID=UPI0029053D05|nr:GIY-YIG nuclease family protein [Anaerococcus prevotii]MDU2558563.1 GIY-YIG nuclease family protein [Anaerococcus prevotii]MDU2584601.1 GIY-YIG nuclease family protein [Anaerococcus prevotii]
MSHFVYLLTDKTNSKYYIGYTNNLIRRTYEHRNHLKKGSFSDKYNIGKLVYYEVLEDYENAREREIQMKKYGRAKKEALVNSMNPEWKDLYYDIIK